MGKSLQTKAQVEDERDRYRAALLAIVHFGDGNPNRTFIRPFVQPAIDIARAALDGAQKLEELPLFGGAENRSANRR